MTSGAGDLGGGTTWESLDGRFLTIVVLVLVFWIYLMYVNALVHQLYCEMAREESQRLNSGDRDRSRVQSVKDDVACSTVMYEGYTA